MFDAFAPFPNSRLLLVPGGAPDVVPCEASLDHGGLIGFSAVLEIESNPVALIMRRLFLRGRYVHHEYLSVFEPYRNYGIAPAVLKTSFDFFDELEMRYVVVLAALETGRWYWAQCGFTFLERSDRDGVEQWAQQTLRALGIQLDTRLLADAGQFLRMGEPQTVSIEELSQAMPGEAQRFHDAALANNINPVDQIPLGKAILVCGPEWWGRLDLNGPSRTVFDVFVQNRLIQLRRRLGQP